MSPPLSAKLFLDCGLLLCMIVGATTKSAIVQNGAYHNVVVEIQRDVPHDDCVNFLSNLEVRYFFIWKVSYEDLLIICFPQNML